MIRNEYTVTKDLYMDWFRENQKKGIQLKITIMWLVILAILIIATVVYIISPLSNGPSPWLLLEVAFFIYSVYHLFFRRKIQTSALYDKMAAQLGENWTRTIEFYDDVIVVRDGKFEVQYPYSEITSVKDEGRIVYIETETKVVIRLYKDKFSEGDFKLFRRFIESKAVMKCFF